MGVGARTFASAGQISQHYIPGSFSRINSILGVSGTVSTSNGVIMGQCTGGKPGELLAFNNSAIAQSALRSGPLMEAVNLAFNPGGGYSPGTIYVMRVNTAVQGSLNLDDAGANPMITLTADDYGLHTNKTNVTVEDGTNLGKKVTIGYDTNSEVFDDTYRSSITITHASATVTITNTSAANTMVLSVGTITIDFDTYTTMGDVEAYINDQAGYTAVVTPGQETADPKELDGVSAQSLVGGYVCQSTMEAIVDIINLSSAYMTAIAVNAAQNRAIPANLTKTYFTGGSEGAYTGIEWTAALLALEGEDIQFISTPDAETSVHSAIKSHVVAMCAVTGKRERQYLVGGAYSGVSKGTAITTAKTNAASNNSKFGLYAFNGGSQYNAAGVLTNFGASYATCMLMGMCSTININEPLTTKTLNFVNMEYSLSESEKEDLIKNGVAPLALNEFGIPSVIRPVTTYQTNDLKWNEFSMAREMLFVSRDLRTVLQRLYIGRPQVAASLSMVRGSVISRLNYYTEQLQVFPKNEAGVSYWGLTLTIAGDTLTVRYTSYITAPLNFIFITSSQTEMITL